jgi:hypothetical protein
MPLEGFTNAELIRIVDNNALATPMERALAQRLDEVMVEIKLVNKENSHLDNFSPAQDEDRFFDPRPAE